MIDIRKIHRQAMALAKRANEAKNKQRFHEFNLLTKESLKLELLASNVLKDEFDTEPTRSVLLLTAATLASNIESFEQSRDLLQTALAGKPHIEIKEELEKLLSEVLISLESKKVEIVSANKKGSRKVKIAILDLYDGLPNQGMRCIQTIISQWAIAGNIDVEVLEFDVRDKNEIPDMSFEIYISSGGPGNPLENRFEEWDINWCKWLGAIDKWNVGRNSRNKKHVFLIGFSFLLAARFFNLGLVCKRKSTSFGVVPITLLKEGELDPVFDKLSNPFYALDARDFQIIQPDYSLIERMGGKILCIEKQRPHVPYERAVMGIRFNEFMIGTVFHPEADPVGVSLYLQTEEKRKIIIENYGVDLLESMLVALQDPEKLIKTQSSVLINFFNWASGISSDIFIKGNFPDSLFSGSDFNLEELVVSETLGIAY